GARRRDDRDQSGKDQRRSDHLFASDPTWSSSSCSNSAKALASSACSASSRLSNSSSTRTFWVGDGAGSSLSSSGGASPILRFRASNSASPPLVTSSSRNFASRVSPVNSPASSSLASA